MTLIFVWEKMIVYITSEKLIHAHMQYANSLAITGAQDQCIYQHYLRNTSHIYKMRQVLGWTTGDGIYHRVPFYHSPFILKYAWKCIIIYFKFSRASCLTLLPLAPLTDNPFSGLSVFTVLRYICKLCVYCLHKTNRGENKLNSIYRST